MITTMARLLPGETMIFDASHRPCCDGSDTHVHTVKTVDIGAADMTISFWPGACPTKLYAAPSSTPVHVVRYSG